MIKLFRKTRQNLLMENKTSKYFKYAFGEIVLVVIGILIALQINTWNQQRSNQNTLKQFLEEYRKELEVNIKNGKRDSKFLENQKQQKEWLLVNKRLDTIPIDVLEPYVETHSIHLDYSTTILKRFENSQITSYGKYGSIFLSLQEFYGFQWPFFKEAKEKHNNEVDKDNNFWRYQQDSYELKYSNGNNALIADSKERKKELILLLKSPIVRNILKTDFKRKEILKVKVDGIVKEAERHLEHINKVLDDETL